MVQMVSHTCASYNTLYLTQCRHYKSQYLHYMSQCIDCNFPKGTRKVAHNTASHTHTLPVTTVTIVQYITTNNHKYFFFTSLLLHIKKQFSLINLNLTTQNNIFSPQWKWLEMLYSSSICHCTRYMREATISLL